jgi:predicted Rossmann fold flavoprotein
MTAATDVPPPIPSHSDVLVVGAGAAGLFAAAWAGRTAREAGRALTIVAVDGAKKLGAKILVAGGGRCNVTHHAVSEADYAGATPPAIRKVLRRFPVADTIRFFRDAGVEFYREADTGKLFPVSDSSRTVLDALLREAVAAGVRIHHPARVTSISRADAEFVVATSAGTIRTRRLIVGTGGKSLPKSGSDGGGFDLARSLGHTLTDPIVPALVPLLLPEGHWIRSLAGLALPATLTLRSGGGKRLYETTGSTLCTHLGLSGPAVLDISRHWLVHRHTDAAAAVSINWLPDETAESIDRLLVEGQRRGAAAVLRERLTDRLARCLCDAAGAPPAGDLTRDARRAVAAVVAATPLPIVGDRGFTVAEATAGGVPLTEIRLETMESRVCPGLHFAGEVLDVDGRIGGFNFQWAWASGYVAGTAAARACAGDDAKT